VAFNVGGIASGLLFGYAVRKFGLKWPTIAALLTGSAGIHIFGLGQESLDGWKMVTLFCGFMTNAAMIGLYSILAKVFPANVRSTGTGFVIGAGRIGAASSPILAGLLFTSVEGLYLVSAIMAMGSVVAALLLLKSNLDERLAD
jgi:MFS family permease